MKNNQISKKIIKQKITSIFVIFCFIISNFFYARPTYAFDFNQFLANAINWSKDITDAIEKYGGGVLKASLSTALNEFAKTLAQNTVDSVANGGNGQEPLYFNFSLEDSITAAVDNAVGSFLDNLANQPNGLDLCKPIGAVDVNWKFKLMLNIIPDLNAANTVSNSTQYNCTLSKFVDNVKTSITNITTSIQKAFAKDCFSEFEKNDICGVFHSFAGLTAGFDLNSLKNYYGYDTSPVFCKETTYYLKSGSTYNQLISAIGKININSICGTMGGGDGAGYGTALSINKGLVSDNFWTTNANDCLKKNSSSAFDVSNLTSSIFNTSDGTCLVSFKYCKFDDNGSVVFDRAKQKKFISQYNNCYRLKVKEALGSLIEVGPALPTDKLISQEINSKCESMSESLFNNTSPSSTPLISRALLSETNNKFAFFIARKMSPAVFAGYVSIGNVINNGEPVTAIAATDEKKDFPFLSKIVVYEAKSWNDFQNQIGKSSDSNSSLISKVAAGYDILYFNDSGTEYFYYHNNGKLNKINLIPIAEYNQILEDNRYASKREYITTMCANLNSENAKAYIAAEEAQDNEKMANVKSSVAAEKAAAKENTTKEYPVSGSFKSVTESISKQITTPSEAVQKQFETSLDIGTNALQPTGDLFIDPIKIFLTTLLSESSNTLLRGLFDTVMPVVSEPEISDFDANEYITNEAENKNTCDNSNDYSKFSNYTPCGANYQCQSCCCTTSSPSNTGIMYCFPLEYCE